MSRVRGWDDGDLDPFAAMSTDEEVMRFVGGPVDRAETWRRIALRRRLRDGGRTGALEWAWATLDAEELISVIDPDNVASHPARGEDGCLVGRDIRAGRADAASAWRTLRRRVESPG